MTFGTRHFRGKMMRVRRSYNNTDVFLRASSSSSPKAISANAWEMRGSRRAFVIIFMSRWLRYGLDPTCALANEWFSRGSESVSISA